MMSKLDRTEIGLLIALPILILIAFILPKWVVNYIHVSMGTGMVALGVMIQMRAGLVSFGQGLYFCVGGYAAGMTVKFLGISDLFVLLAIGVVAALILSAIQQAKPAAKAMRHAVACCCRFTQI